MTRTEHKSQHRARSNVHCKTTSSTGPGDSVVRHAEVFVGAAGGIGELQKMRLGAVSMSWTVGTGWRGGKEGDEKK